MPKTALATKESTTAVNAGKQTRTKLEEDLLLPSSSSSEASDEEAAELRCTDDRDWIDVDDDDESEI